MRIYLDHNATTPVAPEVADAMATALRTTFGNPSSLHRHGQQAKTALDEARAAVARLLGAEPTEIVFTSGGSEADNLAIRGAAVALAGSGRRHLVGERDRARGGAPDPEGPVTAGFGPPRWWVSTRAVS